MATSKVPVPDVVHVDEVALPPRDPESVCVVPEQIVASLPAFVVATGLIVKTIASFTDGQGPAGSFEVIVSVTDPEIISAADAV